MVGYPIGFAASQSLPRSDEVVPLGGIIQWSGAIIDIPSGYQLCDGTNGTPDLRDKFLIGAGDTYAVDEAGGDLNHTHPFNTEGHDHPNSGTVSVAGSGPNDAWDASNPSGNGGLDGFTSIGGALPPFLALAYIQRMV